VSAESPLTVVAAPESLPGNWKAGLAGGVVGSAVFAALLFAVDPAVLSTVVPVMYGLGPSTVAAGTAIHVAHGGVLGVGFAAIVGVADRNGALPGQQVGLGLAYGLLLWAVLAAVVMPVWLSAVGFEAAPAVPNVDRASLVGHAAYGAFLGAAYHALEGL